MSTLAMQPTPIDFALDTSAVDLADSLGNIATLDSPSSSPAATIRRPGSIYQPRRVGPPTAIWDRHPDWRGYFDFATASLPAQTLTRFTTSAVEYVSSTSIARDRRPDWRVFFTEFYWRDERGEAQIMLREDLIAAFDKLICVWELPPGAYDDLWSYLCTTHCAENALYAQAHDLISRLTALQRERGALATAFSEQLELLRQMELAGFTPKAFHASDLAYPMTYASLQPTQVMAHGRLEYAIPSAPEAEFVDGTVSDWVFHVARFVLLYDPPLDPAIGELAEEAERLVAQLVQVGGGGQALASV